jgi:hypothetical protein
MNTRFNVFASYNILQYLCDFIHVLKMPKKSQIIEYSSDILALIELLKLAEIYWDLCMHITNPESPPNFNSDVKEIINMISGEDLISSASTHLPN